MLPSCVAKRPITFVRLSVSQAWETLVREETGCFFTLNKYAFAPLPRKTTPEYSSVLEVAPWGGEHPQVVGVL